MMNVLSLFDGISCGQLALKKAGILVDNYYASEINKYSISVTMKNFPNTIQLGDISGIDASKLPRIDLLIGGSPCQDLSGCQVEGKGLRGEKSRLFYEFVRILKESNPTWFLLENVIMKREWQDIITKILGVEPIMINSNLVSAQDRKRLYWTNIPNIDLPIDKGLILKDIIQQSKEVANNFWYSNTKFVFNGNEKKVIATLGLNGHDILKRVNNLLFKSPTLTSCRGGNLQKKVYQFCDLNNEFICRKLTPLEYERLQTIPDGYTDILSNSQRYNVLGDCWTVDVIVHILSHIKKGDENETNN